LRADGTDARLLVDDVWNRPTATNQPPLWFGYYGSTDWSRLFDWWQVSARDTESFK
jgi:hypothetical protein